MDRRSLWPDFRDRWILHLDEDLVAVHKPAGVPSQAADPEWPDDVVTRLKRHLDARYLGVHQRLDRDTSGVLLYARTRRANPGLAKQFEGRTVNKTYVAAVTGWRARGRDWTVLRDRVAKGEGGRVRVVGPKDRRGKSAVTRVREIRRRGERSLLEVRIETGRTHQIRVQLAHAGAPVAGDGLYGGAPAPRLMLHAGALTLRHPVTDEPLALEAPVPGEIKAWLDGEEGDHRRLTVEPAAVRALLDAAVEARWGLGRAVQAQAPTTAFRLVNGVGDGLPGLVVDVYGDHLVAQLYGEEAAGHREVLLDALEDLGFDGIYLKVRPRQANELVDTRRDELAPQEPVRGRPAPDELTIREHGVPYLVRLGDGLSTGIFLDQRENRRRVRELAAGARVLNLFAYTGPFTVAAAVGGAAETVTVDVAAPALAWAERNLASAGVTGGVHRFVRGDVFEELETLAAEGARFDLVLCDPPTYASTRRHRFTSGKDWARLGARVMAVVAPGGRLLASSNDHRLPLRKLRRHLHEAARKAGREVRQMKDLPVPPDFPPPPGEEPHLKAVLLDLP